MMIRKSAESRERADDGYAGDDVELVQVLQACSCFYASLQRLAALNLGHFAFHCRPGGAGQGAGTGWHVVAKNSGTPDYSTPTFWRRRVEILIS